MSLYSLLSALNVKTILFSPPVSPGLHAVSSPVCALYDVWSCVVPLHLHSFQAVRQYAENMRHFHVSRACVCVYVCFLSLLVENKAVCCERHLDLHNRMCKQPDFEQHCIT